jgi:rSAM/selenodomain-associated transferase 1
MGPIGAEVPLVREPVDDRVLAIMMKAPRPGAVKTRLASAFSPARIVALYRALVEDTIELARRVRVKTIAICPRGDEAELARWLPADIVVKSQAGAGLAAGLRSTFDQLCAGSGSRVIAFNADSPHLAPGALESSFAALATVDLVVGPCDDGGYYLVGAKRAYDGLFDAKAMGGGSACQALLSEAARQGLSVSMAAEHYDIDLPADLLRLARDLSADRSRASRTAALLASWDLDGRAAL